MNSQQKTYQRDTSGDHKDLRNKDSVINQEVKRLIQTGVSDYTALQRLRAKYKDEELITSIFDAYKDTLKFLVKKALKFKKLIYHKYAPLNLSAADLIKKAKKYKNKYKMTDDEFDVFVKMVLSDKPLTGSMMQVPNTPIAKTLGYDAILAASDKLKVKPTELDVVNEIVKLYGQTKSLHSQVVLQSLTYRDCAPEALNGTNDFQASKYNYYSYVHPVIAALFLPKFKLVDEHMLIANLGNIVRRKQAGEPLQTQPDFELYWDLITDPNELVCHKDSPIKDLHNRFMLQTKIWDSVLNLRQGKYYNERLNDFIVAIDNCRGNIYDAPDLTYVKDEGTILRRLLSAFSIRPTIVTTSYLYGLLGASTYNYSANPLSASGVTQVTTVPMIPLRLPLNLTNQSGAVSLEEALNQPQWFVENKMIIPKAQSIMHSRDILIFHVGRRFQRISFSRTTCPYNFSTLPMTVAGFESLNERVVNFSNTITLLNDTYMLRSVVLIERSKTRKNLIVGSSAAILIPTDISEGNFGETTILYDPQGAGEMFQTGDGTQYERNLPITWIPSNTPFNANGNVESFYQRASTRGTIFIYQKKYEAGVPCIKFS